MDRDSLIYALAAGVSIFSIVVMLICGDLSRPQARKAMGVLAASVAVGVTWWLYRHTGRAESVVVDIMKIGIPLLIAAFVFFVAYRVLTRRP